jgi:hypothetical protein
MIRTYGEGLENNSGVILRSRLKVDADDRKTGFAAVGKPALKFAAGVAAD